MKTVRIGHAYGDEHGKGHGGAAGDQTGKEVRIEKWYKRTGGWQYYIEPVDMALANRAADWMERICESPKFGYDRDDRWTGYDAIKAKGFYDAKKSEFDCSSLVLSCYRFAGLLKLREKWGTTSTMRKQFKELGFIVHDEPKYLESSDYLRRGGILLTEGKHTCMVLDNGAKYYPKTPVGKIKILKDLNIREAPVTGEVIGVMKAGDIVYYYGKDEASGWYELYNGFCSGKEIYTKEQKL